MEDSACLIIIRAQGGPCLRIIIGFALNYPHINILNLKSSPSNNAQVLYVATVYCYFFNLGCYLMIKSIAIRIIWYYCHASFYLRPTVDILLIAPYNTTVCVHNFNHEVITRYPRSIDTGTCLVIVRVKDEPCLRIFIRFVFNVPHIIIPKLWLIIIFLNLEYYFRKYVKNS